MLRSMFSGVSGLRAHQTMMDVIGNNIANVNTVGFKASTAVFSDLLSQVLTGAGAATDAQGGTNPAAVGLGARLAGISTNFGQGAAQTTGRATDLSINGDGFFVVQKQGQTFYTRAGSLSFDALGRLVTPDGSILQGWSADTTGAINTNGAIGNLSMPLGQNIPPQATAEVRIGGNLSADAADGTVVSTSIQVYDDTGAEITLTLEYTKTASGWDLQPYEPDTDGDGNLNALGSAISLAFDGSGQLDPPFDPANPGSFEIDMSGATSGTWAGSIVLNPGATSGVDSLVSFSGDNGVAALSQDGFALGALQSFTIGADGIVTGVFSNGQNRAIGQIALATFANPVGLDKAGDSLYRPTVNSGLPQVGIAGAGGRGTLAGSTLEMSNVDLAREFTNLIVAQRGFQANSRIISASDELLQDLVNLKR